MAAARASSGRGASQPGTTSKAAPPRPADAPTGVVAPKPGVAPTGVSYVEFSLASFNFGTDQQMLQGRVCI